MRMGMSLALSHKSNYWINLNFLKVPMKQLIECYKPPHSYLSLDWHSGQSHGGGYSAEAVYWPLQG